MKNSSLGIVSFLGTYTLLFLAAWHTESFAPVWQGMQQLLSGNALEITSIDGDYRQLPGLIAALVVIKLPICIGAGLLIAWLFSKGENDITKMMLPDKEGKLFKMFFWLCLLEELTARYLFLAGLTKVPGLGGTGGFYFLFLVGNSAWALIHLYNYKPDERQVLRVLPQFIGGVFYTYLWLKAGLAGALLAHFASNAVLFSLSKIQRAGAMDFLAFAYSALVAGIAWFMLGPSPKEAWSWLNANSGFTLPGWSFRDYAALLVCFTMGMTALAELLLYDKSNLKKLQDACTSPQAATKVAVTITGFIPFLALFVVSLVRLFNRLLAFVLRRAVSRAGVLGVVLCFGAEARSANAVARTFWQGVPAGFVMVAVLQAVTFWQACLLMGILMAVEIPLIVFKGFDD